MPEIDDLMTELRQRIMGPSASGPPKPARSQHQETNEEGPATSQSVNVEYQRHGSAAVALRRLAHPGRDGPVIAELSQLIRRLALDMPELLEEIVTLVERRTAEPNETDAGAAPKPTESVAPAALVQPTPTPQDDDTGTATISLRFDTQMLAHIDADAKRLGISRTAWVHVAAGERLEGRR
jgi:hypothetical protein